MSYNYCRSFDKGFPLSNCVLYTLGWYYRTGDFWADLRDCVEADGYVGNIMSKFDIARLILNVADDWNCYAANNGYKIISVSTCLLPQWKIEGWDKYDSENPELLAMVWEILTTFAFDYNREELPLKKPHFSKKSPLKPQGYKSGETYTHANKRVERYKWAE